MKTKANSITLPDEIWETISDLAAQSYSENRSATITELIKDGIITHIEKIKLDRENYKETVKIMKQSPQDYGDSIYDELFELTDDQLDAFSVLLRNFQEEIRNERKTQSFK